MLRLLNLPLATDHWQIVYFGRCVPWIIIDKMPMFRKYKLQPTKVPTNAQMWKCTKAVLLSHFTIELPQVSLSSRDRRRGVSRC